MNKVGYDFAVLGNHEFDYGMDGIKKAISRSKAKYLNCNITYSGNKENALAQTASYTIANYGDIKIGFVGVTTPGSTNTSTPVYFQEDGKFVYDFKSHNQGKDLFDSVQTSVNSCLSQGVNYVVVIAHLGTGTGYEPYTSTNMIAKTVGIDAVIDGHSHSIITCELVKNKEGKDVVLTSCGEKLRNIGKLTISSKGISSELINNYKNKEKELDEFIASIRATYNAELQKVVGTSTTHLSLYDEKYVRLIRNRETNLGDWCTDALLHATKGDICLFNGGSIRADIKKGVVTVGDLRDINGFNNMICKIAVTGQEILDALEMSYRKTLNVVTVDGKWSVGEFGGFFQVSGLKCTIDTSDPSFVIVDDNGMYEKVNGKRRVKNVMIKENDEYVPIDVNKEYILVSTDYLIKESGDGINHFTNHKLIEDSQISVTKAYIDYFKYLNGDLSSYEKPQGRITIE
ncbi:MAG: bifunctional metallophosphatase/5'-nucleotidase, partial [Candidatus Riflebacteria bacterium]|nr:bifunctional metallophosphatase/5'-nucleotidase [Candidatus Riflebacteria bacterium]